MNDEIRALVREAFTRLLADDPDGHISEQSALAARAILARALDLDRTSRQEMG